MTETKKSKTVSYLAELKEELQKVTWTTKSELIFCTKVVVYSTFFFGLGVYLVDLSIKGVLQFIGTLIRLIFG